MCTSLEQGYSYYCLQEVCSVFSVFKQFIGNSIYYMATLKILIIQGNMSKVGVFHLPQDTFAPMSF